MFRGKVVCINFTYCSGGERVFKYKEFLILQVAIQGEDSSKWTSFYPELCIPTVQNFQYNKFYSQANHHKENKIRQLSK